MWAPLTPTLPSLSPILYIHCLPHTLKRSKHQRPEKSQKPIPCPPLQNPDPLHSQVSLSHSASSLSSSSIQDLMDPNSSNQAAAMHGGGIYVSLSPNNNGEELQQQQQHQTPSPTPTVQPTSSRRASSSSARTRGRPAGSRNRPKPPIYINQESPNALRTHLMEIPPNHDVVKALKDFVRLRGRGICILSASGSVANVRIRTPVTDGRILNLSGIFELLNLSGTFLPQASSPDMPGLTMFLSHPHGSGNVLGGSVEGQLLAAGIVMVTATSFTNAEFERLPLAPEDGNGNNEQVSMILPVLGEEAYNVAHLQPKSEAMEPPQQQQMGMHSNGFNSQNLIPATDFWEQPF